MHRVLGLLVLIASFGGGWLWMDYREFERTPLDLPADGLTYTLPQGGSAGSLASDLVAAGYLPARWEPYLRWMAWSSGRAAQLKAGEYRLAPGLTASGLLDLLVSGKVVQYPLTIIEAWTFRQLRAAVREHPALRQTLEGLDDATVMAALGRPGEHPEGRFFPDTYLFPRGTTDLEFLGRAYKRMGTVLDEAWRQRVAGLPLKDPYQVLVLASIVEKESGMAAERPQIAGVFVRRLQKGMKLQADPTVIYGLGDGFDGNLRRSDLETDTPYNSYTRTGLPPTPICLPGRAAIQAVVSPAGGSELYFVAKGDGSHYFSASLDEHQRAVNQYQRKRPGTP
jgi:UPF0755 protein